MVLRHGDGHCARRGHRVRARPSDHPAGLRTHILVSLASATFMLVSTQFVYFQHYTNQASFMSIRRGSRRAS